MKKNIFNQKIPEIKELLREQEVREYIEATLLKILSYLEIKNSKELINLVIEKALNYKSLDNYEKEVHLILDGRRVNQRIPEKLSNRAEIIFEQIKPFLKGHDILDLGCGDGKVGDIISKEQPRQVILSDVYEHGNIANIKLPFTRIITKNKQKVYLGIRKDNNGELTLYCKIGDKKEENLTMEQFARGLNSRYPLIKPNYLKQDFLTKVALPLKKYEILLLMALKFFIISCPVQNL